MKLTIITEKSGEVVGYAPSRDRHATGQPGQFRGGLVAGPGQRMHEVEVSDDLPFTPNAEEIHGRLRALLPKK